MSQPPQPRPWFRLASLARPAPPPAPAPAPAPTPALAQAPRPPFVRPLFGQSFAPRPQPPTPPPQSMPTPPQSPVTPPQPTATSLPQTPPTTVVKPSAPSPKQSPKTPPPAEATPFAVSTSSVPQTPKPRTSAPSSPLPPSSAPSSQPLQLQHAVAAASPNSTNVTHVKTSPVPSPSPLIPESKLKSPSPPPPPAKSMPLSSPPSPLTLPPPQLLNSDHDHYKHNPRIPPETEPKIVMVHEQNVNEMPKAVPRESNHYHHHSHSPSTFAAPIRGKKEKDNSNPPRTHKKSSYENEEFGMRMITLAGENKGAIMELIPRSHNRRHGLFATNHTSWSDGEKLTSDPEGRMKNKDKNHKATTDTTKPFHAYTNSNVQGVNNSILYNCSCTHNDPGVRLSLSRGSQTTPINSNHAKETYK